VCLVRVWVWLRLSCMGCWVRLACFSPCHYCLEIEGWVGGERGGESGIRDEVGYKILRWCVSDSEWGCGGVG